VETTDDRAAALLEDVLHLLDADVLLLEDDTVIAAVDPVVDLHQENTVAEAEIEAARGPGIHTTIEVRHLDMEVMTMAGETDLTVLDTVLAMLRGIMAFATDLMVLLPMDSEIVVLLLPPTVVAAEAEEDAVAVTKAHPVCHFWSATSILMSMSKIWRWPFVVLVPCVMSTSPKTIILENAKVSPLWSMPLVKWRVKPRMKWTALS